MSETQHGPVATDAAGPDAETGEADDVSDYSEEAGGLDPAGEAADAASADGVSEDDAGFTADGQVDDQAADSFAFTCHGPLVRSDVRIACMTTLLTRFLRRPKFLHNVR